MDLVAHCWLSVFLSCHWKFDAAKDLTFIKIHKSIKVEETSPPPNEQWWYQVRKFDIMPKNHPLHVLRNSVPSMCRWSSITARVCFGYRNLWTHFGPTDIPGRCAGTGGKTDLMTVTLQLSLVCNTETGAIWNDHVLPPAALSALQHEASKLISCLGYSVITIRCFSQHVSCGVALCWPPHPSGTPE